jgi:hypothetical protein
MRAISKSGKMAKRNTRKILWIDDAPVASIYNGPQQIVFALRDSDGSHLTISKKNDTFRVEYSSNKPWGSVWDGARRGIARRCGYKHWQKHGNYILNRSIGVVADSSVSLINFSMPRRLKAKRASLDSRPAIRMKSPDEPYHLSLEFSLSGTKIVSDSEVFEGEIGNLIIALVGRSQPKGMRVIRLAR